MKFRKKPVVVEAWQVGPINEPHWIDVALANDDLYRFENHRGPYFSMPHESCEDGRLYAYQGDWIIRGIKGELYPCKPDIFEATYERVEE